MTNFSLVWTNGAFHLHPSVPESRTSRSSKKNNVASRPVDVNGCQASVNEAGRRGEDSALMFPQKRRGQRAAKPC